MKEMTHLCYFMKSETKKEFPSLKAAREAAEGYVGNSSFAKPFPEEDTYLYGPGNGDTTVMVRRIIRWRRDDDGNILGLEKR